MNVVADASPLIILAKIGYLELLPKLYERVHISTEVYSEVVVAGAGLPGASELADADWILVKSLRNPASLESAQLQRGLDIGELSTILLAKELRASTVLIDEARGRRFASTQGLEVRGTVGILENLYRRGFMNDLRSAFQKILAKDAYIDRDLLNRRLEIFGLSPL